MIWPPTAIVTAIVGTRSRIWRSAARPLAALIWAQEHRPDLSATAAAFLKAASVQRRGGRRLRRAVVSALSVLSLIASGTAAFAFQQETRARSAVDRAPRTRPPG